MVNFNSEEREKKMETIYKCQDCEWFTDDTAYMSDYTGKLYPGAIVPDGECPECGGVCFADETPEEAAAERVRRAAPELLAALELMLHEDGPISGDGWDNPWVEVARRAINRARGVPA